MSLVVARLGRAGSRALLTDEESPSRVSLIAYLLAAAVPAPAVAGLYLSLLSDSARRGHQPPEVSWVQLRWSDLPDDVQRRIQPAVEMGHRLRIQPSWESEPRDRDRVTTRLHPTAAFGNGFHSTTRLCLEALEELLEPGRRAPCATLVDLGTGSGILAIAAVLLGASTVHAADTDLLSVRAARANRDLNAISAMALPIHLGSCDTLAAVTSRPVDGILCNLLAGALLPLVPAISALAGPRSWAVISGFRADQETDLRASFVAHGWSWGEEGQDEGWGCVVARREA